GYVILGYQDAPLHKYGWIGSIDYWGVYCKEVGCEKESNIVGIEELLKKTKFAIHSTSSEKNDK
ncbi:MAG: hypothetical protein ACPGVB_03650, partial [Chitinophagales bacterium]